LHEKNKNNDKLKLKDKLKDKQKTQKKRRKRGQMYLGQKGYTLAKAGLTDADQVRIKKDLTFRQETFATKVMKVPGLQIKVWRENANKLYLPRFYGEKKWGRAESRLPPPETIQVPFRGDIREAQRPAAAAFLEKGCGLLELPCGFGKTILALYIVSQLRLKTLIIVHKEFLLEQWVERIAEFLPLARVGRIQGTTIDTVDKDIVLVMLQSLSMKEYDPKVFEGFGLTIIDEVHHIAAEVFSQALFKTVTQHMLGLSATMQRKDGLSDIFKLFIGDIVYSAEREKNDNVLVHKIEYKVADEAYNATETNWQGDTQFATMIRKVCEFAPRSEFILHVLAHLLESPTNAQIMILAQNRSLLDYLYAAITARQMVDVGFYVGGMKQTALKKSESCRVILGTFAMAEEALDIKTLTTMFFTTSKTDVTQAVGRILRVKHEKPMVVDLVDQHPVFANQWRKRETFYRKHGYTIVASDSATFPNLLAPVKKRKTKEPAVF
jgi:superfamily II DNA or RNA helicase